MEIFTKKMMVFLFGKQGGGINNKTRRLIMATVFLALYLIVLSVDFVSDKVAVEEGEVCERDIVAPRTMSYINTDKTKKLENEVLAGVAPVYDIDVTVLAQAEDTLKELFRVLKSDNLPAPGGEIAAAEDKPATPAKPTTEELVARKRAAIAALDGLSLPEEAIDVLLTLPAQEAGNVEDLTLNTLRVSLQRGIHTEEIELTKKHIAIEVGELNANNNIKYLINVFMDKLLRANMTLNVKETEKRKSLAAGSIDPVREVVRKGQVVVRRGDIVTAQQIAVMSELGLHKGQVGWLRLTGLAVYITIVMGIMIGFLYKFEFAVYRRNLMLVLLGLIMLIALILGKIAWYYSYFAAPLATGVLLAAILLNPRVGMMLGIGAAMLYGVIVDYNLRAVIAAVLSSTVSVYSVAKLAHGYSLTKTGFMIAAVNCLVIATTGIMTDVESVQLALECLAGVIAGMSSAIITTGMLPYLENAFNITSPIKLLELGQPNQPLLQRLLMEAPGTYHHSVLIGNLAETAADAIGADPVTVRVGAYYHDVGKIKRPYFFVENQFGSENPHDKLTPSLSTLIITSHVKDGLELCRQYNIPKVIQDIVAQHHGTLLVGYFYRMAVNENGSDAVVEADFRYEGPRPRTKEAALIMIADACEAAVRSISKPNATRIEAMIRKLIRERLNDGQFDECNLTLRDLSQIGDVYTRILSSMFHSRIEYPDTVKEIGRKRETDGSNIRELPAPSGAKRLDGANDKASD